jgi:hypothetical protein
LNGQRVVEELVVGRPPEGVVDDDGSVEGGVLEKGAVEGDVVGDAVDDDRVARGLSSATAPVSQTRPDAVDVAGVDVLDQRAGKAVLHAKQNADLLHAELLDRDIIDAIAYAAHVDCKSRSSNYDEHVISWLRRLNQQAMRACGACGGPGTWRQLGVRC